MGRIILRAMASLRFALFCVFVWICATSLLVDDRELVCSPVGLSCYFLEGK